MPEIGMPNSRLQAVGVEALADAGKQSRREPWLGPRRASDRGFALSKRVVVESGALQRVRGLGSEWQPVLARWR
jgi:hypothetical protein